MTSYSVASLLLIWATKGSVRYMNLGLVHRGLRLGVITISRYLLVAVFRLGQRARARTRADRRPNLGVRFQSATEPSSSSPPPRPFWVPSVLAAPWPATSWEMRKVTNKTSDMVRQDFSWCTNQGELIGSVRGRPMNPTPGCFAMIFFTPVQQIPEITPLTWSGAC
ncbi:hypothetical protein F5Y06DRAFT_25130 [Hypoxylon sp. FL0890]|nr:hypothetical protein F5Y06DRAFT_25130 [Hypoxylon sp. FL0890]